MGEQQENEPPARALRRLLKLAQEGLSDLSWELEELELQIQTLQGQEPSLSARELEELRRRRSLQEELVLQQMLRIDELRAQIGEAEHADVKGREERA